MFWKKSEKETLSIDWHALSNEAQLSQIIEESLDQDVLIYKHSTRCGISSMVLNRLERSWVPELNQIKPYFLDLITYRDLSNAVAQRFSVYHESPQIILITGGKATYNESHMGISSESLLKEITNA